MRAEAHRRPRRRGSGPRTRQHALWLSRDELTEMIGEMREVVTARMTYGPSPERTRHLLSPILFPAETQLPRND